MVWNGVVLAREHLGVESFHRLGPERRQKSDHLVKDAACRPYIAPVIVRHVLPYLRARIVGSSRLSAHKTTFYYSRHIHVTEFDNALLRQEDIGALNVSVTDSQIMQGLETSHNLNEKVPDLFLGELSIALLVVIDHHEEITAIRILHHNAETVRTFLKESLLIADDVWVVH